MKLKCGNMSFSQKVKEELCIQPMDKRCCILAESYGILLFANVFRADEIRLITQNEGLANRAGKLFSHAFGIHVPALRNAENGRYILKIGDATSVFRVFDTLDLDPDVTGIRLNTALVEQPCCQGAFLRGAFLSGGCVASPDTRYHLEFSTPYRSFCDALASLLERLSLTPRVTMRAGKYMIYFKRSEAIEEILTRAGAHQAALAFMQAKVVKEVRNSVNRYVNCETANISKTVEAARVQTQAIRRLSESGQLEAFPEMLRLTAQLRLENPEASLSALGRMFSPPVNRATLNYRLKKLMELSERLCGEEGSF